MPILIFRKKSRTETKEAEIARKKSEKESREADIARKQAAEEQRVYRALKPYITGDKIDVDKALDAGVSEGILLAAGVPKSDIKFYKDSKKLERQTKKDELKAKQSERKLKLVTARTSLIKAQTKKRIAKANKSKAQREQIESAFSVIRSVTGRPSKRRKKKKSPLRKKVEQKARSIRINV